MKCEKCGAQCGEEERVRGGDTVLTEKEQAMLNEAKARWQAEDARCAAANIFAEKKKKIVLALLQQCKDEGLTVKQVESVCETAAKVAGAVTSLRAGITPEGIQDFGW